LIDTEHATHPDRGGLELVQFREALSLEPEVFERLLVELSRGDLIRNGDVIRRASHKPTLPPNLNAAGERIRTALTAKPFDPPSRKELANDAAAQQALRFLRETNEVIEISGELVLARAALEQMREKVQQALRTNGGASVSELRQLLGSSRRVVVPLLEYFDRVGLTKRVGDKRVLASAR
jgi:selenocysteine-specific elongation factor